MAKSLNELLKLTRTQMNEYKKGELMDILEAADSSEGNTDIKDLIESIAKLTTEITSLKQSLTDHQEATRRQIDDLKQNVSKQGEVIAKQQLYLELLDRREGECNLVILGVPEDNVALEGASNDTD